MPETESNFSRDSVLLRGSQDGIALSADSIVLQATKLTKIYGKQRAVDGIEFTVKRGETFGLLGPNGAGKSTTMRMIACRTPLTSGDLRVEGLDVRTQGRRIRSLIGVVPQENNLDPDLNVRKNLIIYASYFRIPKKEAATRAEELLSFIGMADRGDAKIDLQKRVKNPPSAITNALSPGK